MREHRPYHVHHVQLVLLPHPVYYRVQLVEHALPVELVLLECSLKALSVLEELHALPVEHSVHPVTFVFAFVRLSVEHSES